MKTVVYKTTSELECAYECMSEPADVVICVSSTLTVSGFGYIDGQITAVSKSGCCDGNQVYSYYIEYNEAQFLNTAYVLTNAAISGVFCKDCLTSWVQSQLQAGQCFSCENIALCNYPVVYPECYGAVGDGEHDDSSAFATLLSEHPSNVYIKLGYNKNYLLEDTLHFPITSRNIVMEGSSLFTGAVDGAIIKIGDLTTQNNAAQNIVLSNFRINGPGALDATYPNQVGLEIDAVLGCYVSNVIVTNIPGTGIVGRKSQASGSTYWNLVKFDHVQSRFVGKQCMNLGADAAVDDFKAVSCMFNHGGTNLNSNVAEGATYIKAVTVGLDTCEVSGNYASVGGYRWGLQLSGGGGVLSSMHYEVNGNDQAGSADLLLDVDTRGIVIMGSNHYGSDSHSAKYCIQDTGYSNYISNVTYSGDVAHAYDYIVEAGSAKNPYIGQIRALNIVPVGPNLKPVNVSDTWATGPVYVGYNKYLESSRRRERFQTRYAGVSPAQIVISGWGDTAIVKDVRAYDSHGDFTIQATGTGQTNPATITITFADGAWTDETGATQEPTCFFYQRNTGSGGVLSIPQVAINATRILFTANSAPVAGATYTFSWFIVGM